MRVSFARWMIMSPAMWAVAVADLAGAVAGYSYWYGSTILASPWYYWIFVPDCPIAATLMGLALLAYHFGRKWHLLGLLAAGTCIKYGLWTVVSRVIELAHGGPASLEGISMLITHFILLVQGVALLWVLRYRLAAVMAASLYLIANDLVDYVAGQRPRLPEAVEVEPMMRLAIVSTAIIVVFWMAMTWVSARRARVEARAPGKGGGA